MFLGRMLIVAFLFSVGLPTLSTANQECSKDADCKEQFMVCHFYRDSQYSSNYHGLCGYHICGPLNKWFCPVGTQCIGNPGPYGTCLPKQFFHGLFSAGWHRAQKFRFQKEINKIKNDVNRESSYEKNISIVIKFTESNNMDFHFASGHLLQRIWLPSLWISIYKTKWQSILCC